MKTKAFQLEIPAEVGEQLHLTDQTAAKLIVRRGRLVVQFEESRLSIFEKGVLAWPVVMALIASIGYYFFCGWQQHNYVQLSGDYSLATSIILVGVVMGILLFAGFFIRDRNNPHNQFVNNIYWRNFPVIVLSFALILALVLIGGMWLLGILFKGAVFDRFTASIILFAFTVVTNVAMVYVALIVDASILSTVLMLVIISGVVISMAVNNQRYWWQHNLSFLGTSNASSGWQFNATLIFAALLMIALVDYLFVSLQNTYPKSRQLWILRDAHCR